MPVVAPAMVIPGAWSISAAKNSAHRWKNLGAHLAQMGIHNHRNGADGIINSELGREARSREIDQKADRASIRVNQCMPLHVRRQSSMRGKVNTSSPFSTVMLLFCSGQQHK